METNYFYDTVLIHHSNTDAVKKDKFYTGIKEDNHFFIFNENGNRTLITEPEFKWQKLDKIIMIVLIKTSLLDSVKSNKIYRVFYDQQNDERYIFDKNATKVLFDKMLFNFELI